MARRVATNSQESGSQKGATLSFRGHFAHSIDDKGRVSLPADFRKILTAEGSGSVVITNYVSEGARCLEGFSISAWEAFEKKLRSKSRFGGKLQRLENFYLSRSSECQVDSIGRILIPSHLRQYAGLSGEVTFTSSIHGFRIWDTRVWNHIFSEAEKALLDNPDLFAELDI